MTNEEIKALPLDPNNLESRLLSAKAWDFGTLIRRTNALPLDATSIFVKDTDESPEAVLEKLMATSNAGGGIKDTMYAGQLISIIVYNSDAENAIPIAKTFLLVPTGYETIKVTGIDLDKSEEEGMLTSAELVAYETLVRHSEFVYEIQKEKLWREKKLSDEANTRNEQTTIDYELSEETEDGTLIVPHPNWLHPQQSEQSTN